MHKGSPRLRNLLRKSFPALCQLLVDNYNEHQRRAFTGPSWCAFESFGYTIEQRLILEVLQHKLTRGDV